MQTSSWLSARTPRHLRGALVTAVALTAAGITGITLGTVSAASASPIPALFRNPVMCTPPTIDIPSRPCGLVIEPKAWYWTGDGSGGLKDLHWTQWGAKRATATGTLVARTGDWQAPPLYGWHYYPVHVEALYPVEDQGRYVFAVVDVSGAHGVSPVLDLI